MIRFRGQQLHLRNIFILLGILPFWCRVWERSIARNPVEYKFWHSKTAGQGYIIDAKLAGGGIYYWYVAKVFLLIVVAPLLTLFIPLFLVFGLIHNFMF